MARLTFSNARIGAIATTCGNRRVRLEDEQQRLGISDLELARLKRTVGLNERRIVKGAVTTSDLCENSARRIFAELDIDPKSLDGLIMVTQTPDFRAPATAIYLASRLGLSTDALAFDVNLGCSGYVYGLSLAFSLIEGGLRRLLLCVGDVASRLVGQDDRTIAPIMGDAGAATLVERAPARSSFVLHSDGEGYKALYIPNSGLRSDSADEGRPSFMIMDGAAVFNFTLQRVPALIGEVLKASESAADDIDYFVLHQPNKYILRNLQKRLSLPESKVPSDTQSLFGNQNSASIPGTINGFLSHDYQTRTLRSVFAGFGIGLSWAACTVETSAIYAPPSFDFDGAEHD